MNTETVKIYCENTNSSLFVQQGTSLMQVADILSISAHSNTPLLACYVNNRLRELNFRIYTPLTLRFIDITHFEGLRVYQRTLFFILYKAVHDLYPDRQLHIKHAVAKGFYCEIEGMENISEQELNHIRDRMETISEPQFVTSIFWKVTNDDYAISERFHRGRTREPRSHRIRWWLRTSGTSWKVGFRRAGDVKSKSSETLNGKCQIIDPTCRLQWSADYVGSF